MLSPNGNAKVSKTIFSDLNFIFFIQYLILYNTILKTKILVHSSYFINKVGILGTFKCLAQE